MRNDSGAGGGGRRTKKTRAARWARRQKGAAQNARAWQGTGSSPLIPPSILSPLLLLPLTHLTIHPMVGMHLVVVVGR